MTIALHLPSKSRVNVKPVPAALLLVTKRMDMTLPLLVTGEGRLLPPGMAAISVTRGVIPSYTIT